MRRAIVVALAALLVLAPMAVAVELDGRAKGGKRNGRVHIDTKDRERGRDKLQEFELERAKFNCPGRDIRRTPPAFRHHRIRKNGRLRKARVVESTGPVTYVGHLRGRFSDNHRRAHGRVRYWITTGTETCSLNRKWRATRDRNDD